MSSAPLLYPAPRAMTLGHGALDLSSGGTLQLPLGASMRTRNVVQRTRAALEAVSAGEWFIGAEPRRSGNPIVRLGIEPGVSGHADGYRLIIDSTGVTIEGDDESGLFYGSVTLRQLLREGPRLPHIEIVDYPAIRRRGVMLDVSRDRVQTLDTLKLLVDELAELKFNEVQLYLEHAFAYPGHETVWGDTSPLTAADILELDRFCWERYVELVPNQNSLGHMHKWLEHPAYAHLAENYPYRSVPVSDVVTEGGRPFWGDIPYSICPSDPEAVDLVLGLFDELLPLFSSRMVNVGLDEPFDLACGRSRALDPGVDPQALYVEHLEHLHSHLSARGYTLQMWGDFVAEHPDAVPQLPTDVIVVDWGYWKDYPFRERAELHASHGRRFYLATGTNAWCSLGGRWEETVSHMRDATAAALEFGAEGVLVTDWGWFEYGTYQQHVISYLGFLLGAGESWSPMESREVDFARALGLLVLGDEDLGEILIELGTICPGSGRKLIDNSPLYWALRNDLDWIRANTKVTIEEALEAEVTLDAILNRLASSRSTRLDGSLIVNELTLAARMMRHAASRTRLALVQDEQEAAQLRDLLHAELPGLIGSFNDSWLRRYRVGGLVGTSARLAALDRDYRVR